MTSRASSIIVRPSLKRLSGTRRSLDIASIGAIPSIISWVLSRPSSAEADSSRMVWKKLQASDFESGFSWISLGSRSMIRRTPSSTRCSCDAKSLPEAQILSEGSRSFADSARVTARRAANPLPCESPLSMFAVASPM